VGCADHATVHHHDKLADGKVGPVFQGKAGESDLKFCRELHAGTLEFTRKNLGLLDVFKEAGACRDALVSLVNSFFTSPTEKAARALIGMSATMDQNGINSMSMVRPFDWGATVDALMPKKGAGKAEEKDGFWLEGSMAVTPPRIRQSLALARKAAGRLNRIRGTS
jgi:hypothetical protein